MKRIILILWKIIPMPVRIFLCNQYYYFRHVYFTRAFREMIVSALKGRSALKKLQRQTGRFCLISPYGIGDVLMGIKTVQRLNPDRKLAVLVRAPYASLAGLFPDVLWIADSALVQNLKDYVVLFHAYRRKRHIFCYFRLDLEYHKKDAVASSQYAFWETYSREVYHVPEDTVADCSQPAVQRGELRLTPDDIVLMPYANSTEMIPASFWTTFAALLKEKGYRVFSNIAPNEAPVEGTEPLQIPLDEVPYACEGCGGCIAIRSGVCDLLAVFSQAKLFVIDVLPHLASAWDVTFFRKTNIYNSLYPSESDIMQDILEKIETETMRK